MASLLARSVVLRAAVAAAPTSAASSAHHAEAHHGHGHEQGHGHDDHGHGHDDHGHGHDHHYDGPNGYFLGMKPGQPYKMEGWELPTFVGLYGGFVLMGVGLYYKPDTSIQTWAKNEAEIRLKELNAKY